jgi:glutamine amidotransferase
VTSKPPVALLDYGAGNLRSVENALRTLGSEVVVTRDPEVVRRSDQLVVPGQGSMPACAEAMRKSGVSEALGEAVRRGAKVLGICVGLQILFEKGEEGGGSTGLGYLPGMVAKLPSNVRLPNIGWSQVKLVPGAAHPLFTPMDGQYVYFAHSFAAPAEAPGAILLAEHGRPYCAGLAHGNLFGVQFHPEKSQKVGLAFLERFLRL